MIPVIPSDYELATWNTRLRIWHIQGIHLAVEEVITKSEISHLFHLLSFCILISKCDQLKWSSSSHKIYTIFPNVIVSLTITKPNCKFCEWAALHKVTTLTITSEDIWRLESQGKSSLHRREMCNDGTERQPQRREIRQQHVLHGSIVPKIPAKLSPSHF